MITMLQPLPVGSAIRLFLAPPAGARYWRILRKGRDDFLSADDDDAAMIYEGMDEVFVDTFMLRDGIMVFYRPFYRMDDGTWQAGPTAHAIPATTIEDQSPDVLSLVRERLAHSLHVDVQRSRLHAPELGYIQVYTAPPSLEQDLRFPLVTISLVSEGPVEQAIGEDPFGDCSDLEGGLFESEGWLADVRLSIVGWSLNSDERIELRKAIRRAVLANMPVFNAAGLSLVTFHQQDVDALGGEYGAPVYQVTGDFSCLAPVRVGARVSTIHDVEVTVHG